MVLSQPLHRHPSFGHHLHHLLAALLGAALALLLSRALRRASRPAPAPTPAPAHDPSYLLAPSPPSCTPPPIYARAPALGPACVRILNASASSLRAELRPPHAAVGYTARLTRPACAPSASVAESRVLRASRARYEVVALAADADYVLEVRAVAASGGAYAPVVCRLPVTTRGGKGVLLANGGFEEGGDGGHAAVRAQGGWKGGVRGWAPFYNGRAVRVCGVVVVGGVALVAPRGGRCCLSLGGVGGVDMFHGVHQGVQVGAVSTVLVRAWYLVVGEIGSEGVVQMVVGWRAGGRDYDGVHVHLLPRDTERRQWERVCVVVRKDEGPGIDIVHVYFHLHGVEGGDNVLLLVDDVSVEVVGGGGGGGGGEERAFDECYSASAQNITAAAGAGERERDEVAAAARGEAGRVGDEAAHLYAKVRPRDTQVTLAVPLTADRVLRLEAMSRLYGGGPIVAMVLVRSAEETEQFARIWSRKAWLRRHVDVHFVRRPAGASGALAINALRNAAVRAAGTSYVLMADVDMTPATEGLACARVGAAAWVQGVAPGGVRRVAALAVFVSDVQHRAARSKAEVCGAVRARAATTYCVTSQRSNRVRRWYREAGGVQTRFTPGYEPYGIVRRDEYPAYDERFSGYGFNKIAWAFAAAEAGWGFVLLGEAFLTHLNHVENDWVQSIDEGHYLQTWRRYLAFVTEVADGYGATTVSTLPPRARYQRSGSVRGGGGGDDGGGGSGGGVKSAVN